MAPKAQTAKQASRGTSGRRARQSNLPYPLTSPTAASYRSPPWQQRVDVYAQNYLVPSEIAICRQLGLRFLPTEARLIASQLAGSPALSLKVRKFIGSLYIYDLSYGLLHDMKSQLRAVLGGGEDIQTNLVENLLNNIRGYRFLVMERAAQGTGTQGKASIVEKPWNGDWVIAGGNNPDGFVPAPPEIQMKVLSSTQENVLRSKGYVILEDVPYTVQRWPTIDQARGGPPKKGPWGDRDEETAYAGQVQMAPYSLTGQGGYAVESCINMLIELCNNRRFNTADFTDQSRLNVFFPLGLEGSNADELLQHSPLLRIRETQNTMFGPGGDYMGNNQNGVVQDTMANIPVNGTPIDNILRQIQVPGSITGATRTQNAAVMEHQRMILTQRDLLGRLGQWIETGEGILAYGGVKFSAYRMGANARDVMGNRPAATKYMEANYDNDTCGSGYERVWYTGQPDDPKSQQVSGYLTLPGGGKAKNIKARVATCQPVMPRYGHLPTGEGPAVHTNMMYATVPRNGGVVAMQKKKRAAPKKRK